MKRPPPTIALIVLSSAAAFGLGWFLKPPLQPTKTTGTNATAVTVPDGSALASNQLTRSVKISARDRTASPIANYLPKKGPMTASDISAAFSAMASENDPLKKQAMFTALLGQLTPDNVQAAFETLRQTRDGRRGGFGRLGGDEMRLLLNTWGRIDGKSAIAQITAIAEKERAEREAGGENRRGERGVWGRGSSALDIYSVLSGWATEDSAAALDYVNSLEGDDRRKGMYTSGIVRGLIVKSVDEAVDFISALPSDDEGMRGSYMSSVAEEMLEHGVGSAAKWATSLGAADLKSSAMNRVAADFANEDLQGAIAWVQDHADEDYARWAVTEVAEEWAERDPQAVIEWADDLPEATQKRVIEEALDEWTERDPMAASKYLAQMPQSELKDSAVEGFAKELAYDNPPAAAAWGATIGDEKIRTSTLTDVARAWLRTDRTAAEAWLPTSGLPAETQSSLLESRGDDRWGRFRGGRGR